MASRLDNLMRQLTWKDDFKTRQMAPPGPGETATAALTEATYNQPATHFDPLPGHRPTVFRMRDDMVVTITLAQTNWVASWVLTRPQEEQDRLLKHEQGHYSIVALIARDFFLDLMELKELVFRNQQEVNQRVGAIQTRYSAATIKAITKKYDDQTRHSLDQEAQRRWNGYFDRSFTEARNPAAQAPDGTPYKVRLIDVVP